MNIGHAFTFVTEDDEWLTKILIAALVALIPIVGQFVVIGWSLEITRRVIHRESELLPNFGEFVDFLIKGFLANLLAFIYMLPLIVIVICGSIVPLFIQDALSGEAARSIAAIISILVTCVTIVYILIAGLLTLAAMGNYAATGEFSAALRFGEVFAMVRASLGAYLLVIFLALIVWTAAGLVGLLLCGIGVIFTSAYAYAVNGHLLGQAYRASMQDMALAEQVQ